MRPTECVNSNLETEITLFWRLIGCVIHWRILANIPEIFTRESILGILKKVLVVHRFKVFLFWESFFLSLKCNDEWDPNSGSPSKRPLLPGTSNNKGRVSLLGRVLQKQTSRPNFQLNLTQDHDRRAAEDHARWEIVLLFPVLFWWQISHVSPNVEILATQDNWYVLVKKIYIIKHMRYSYLCCKWKKNPAST